MLYIIFLKKRETWLVCVSKDQKFSDVLNLHDDSLCSNRLPVIKIKDKKKN